MHEKEKPNTSLESVYGGSDVAPPKTSSSSSVRDDDLSARRKRPENRRLLPSESVRPRVPLQERPRDNKRTLPPYNGRNSDKPTKDPPKLNAKPPEPNKNGTGVMPKNLPETNSTSMEWDPYYLNTKKNEEEKKKLERKNARKKSRNISPISEEDTEGQETDQPIDSVVPQVGSDEGGLQPGAVSDSLYPLNTSDTSESAAVGAAADSSSPPQRTAPPKKNSPPQITSPPQRNSPPQRTSPAERTSPPQRISPRTSGEFSPRDSNDKIDKHTQFSGKR